MFGFNYQNIMAAGAFVASRLESQAGSGGFGLATAVALLLIAVLLYTLVAAVLVALGRTVSSGPRWIEHGIPVLCLLGLGVAGYLTYVETQNVAAVCGPVGDCNAVQASPYARLFGFLPVGLLGMIGYVAMMGAWAAGRFGRSNLARLAAVALLGMTLFGALFSLYLTYLELYVIRAVCAWCLSSAVITALLLLLAVSPAVRTMVVDEGE